MEDIKLAFDEYLKTRKEKELPQKYLNKNSLLIQFMTV